MLTALLCVAVVAAPPALTGEVGGVEPAWSVALQTGAGKLGAELAVFVRPRLHLRGTTGELALTVPLWASLQDTPGSKNPHWLSRWDDVETYGALVERLDLHSAQDGAVLHLGALTQETLGDGALLDHFTNSLDLLRPRSGARLDLTGDTLAFTALVDSIVAPAVWAAQLETRPLAPWDIQALRLAVQAAADLRAAMGGRDLPPGGLATTVALVFGGAHVVLRPYATAVGLSGPATHRAVGAHAGLRLEWRQSDAVDAAALVMRLEGVRAGQDYQPGYFDAAYTVERVQLPGHPGRSKLNVTSAPAGGVRAAFDAHLGAWHLGAYVQAMGNARAATATAVDNATAANHVGAYVQAERPTYSVAASLLRRWLDRADALWRRDPATFAAIEGAYSLGAGGLFAFSRLQHGWQVETQQGLATGVRGRTDWLVGLGLVAGNG